MEIAEMIAEWHSGETLVVEPNIHELPAKLAGHCTLTALNDALATADVLVLLVDHKAFKAIPVMPYVSNILLIPKACGVE
jgi:UDP-N-acetyl-D-mannosaminuronic acid dehydrogenase